MKLAPKFKPQFGGQEFTKFNGAAKIEAMYDFKWEKYRKRFLKENPLCYSCGLPSNVVDHLVPHKGDSHLFTKLDNHIPLCEKCHNYVTTKFDRFYSPKTGIQGKLKWLHANRGRNDLHSRVKVLPKYED